MRKFHTEYPNVQTLYGQLSWSHICELLIIENKEKRSFYEKETVNSAWSIREMKRQIDSSLYERLLLSSGKANKEKVLELAQKGQEISKAEDLLKNPYVFEFLGVQRITINNTHYYVDMVFYNKILRSYILIELKTAKINISDAGQLNTYLNYYKTEINDENDTPPIGIILCAEKD